MNGFSATGTSQSANLQNKRATSSYQCYQESSSDCNVRSTLEQYHRAKAAIACVLSQAQHARRVAYLKEQYELQKRHYYERERAKSLQKLAIVNQYSKMALRNSIYQQKAEEYWHLRQNAKKIKQARRTRKHRDKKTYLLNVLVVQKEDAEEERLQIAQSVKQYYKQHAANMQSYAERRRRWILEINEQEAVGFEHRAVSAVMNIYTMLDEYKNLLTQRTNASTAVKTQRDSYSLAETQRKPATQDSLHPANSGDTYAAAPEMARTFPKSDL